MHRYALPLQDSRYRLCLEQLCVLPPYVPFVNIPAQNSVIQANRIGIRGANVVTSYQPKLQPPSIFGGAIKLSSFQAITIAHPHLTSHNPSTHLLPLHPPTRPRRHLNPLPLLRPRPRLRVIQRRRPLHERKAEILIKPQLRLALPHEPASITGLIIDEPAEALDVVDEDADAVEVGLEVGPGEGYVGVACGCGSEFDDGGEGGGEERVVLCVVEEGGVGLEEGIEAPARDAVDEETEEDGGRGEGRRELCCASSRREASDALEEQAGAGLHARPRDEEDGEDVVVDAQVEAGDADADDDADEDDGVEAQVAEQAALGAEGPDLLRDDGEEDDHDEGEGGFGAGLLVEVGADPAAAEPEDGLVGLRGEAAEGAADGEGVEDECDEHSWEEPGDESLEKVKDAAMRRRVGDEAHVNEDSGEDGEEEHRWGGNEDTQYRGVNDGYSEERPSHVFRRAGNIGLEDEREREVRIEADALDAVPVGAGKGARGAILTDNSAAAFLIIDYTSVNGSLTEEGVPTVSSPRVTCVIVVGAANDQRGVIYFLSSNSSRIEYFETGA
ncbi:hypothetical protein V495_04135 [Pseudogymnoascus sp. VKM F-4514 (FW-929)]|nr:hypothetical protein V495_04135 [Pseudogymnoascus sp. VKM F-4514 (FW-929)]